MRKYIWSRGTLLGLAGPLVAVVVGAGMASCGGDTTGAAGTTSASASGSSGSGQPIDEPYGTTVSSSLALTKDDHTLWIVNQDSDSVSVIDVDKRALLAEIPLGSKPPALDPTTKRFDPAVMPRALAIVSDKKVYVVGEAANRVYVLDAEKRTVLTSITVPAAPVSVAAAPDGSAVYVVSNEAAKITKIDTATDTVTKSLDVTEHPWGASVSADGASLFVTHILLDPGMSVIGTAGLTLNGKVPLADEPRSTVVPFEKRLPNGEARGLYEAVPNPKSGEIWIPHLILAVDTPQPDLDFESTVFPTISTIKADGSAAGPRLLFQPNVPGAKGAFGDSVSGPRSVAFTPDGKLALLALGQSEDVMVFDTEAKVEVGLVRPLPSTMLEGIIVDHAGKHAYVDGRNTHNITVLAIDEANMKIPVAVDGEPIERLTEDPMPAEMRHGQRLFYTANSAKFPITKNFWVACTSCHIEGGSDAVTWLFKEGPRDTPSNAGGPINTGFLLHQALRSNVNQYDETINVEQGGNYSLKQPAQKADLDALALYVNYGISLPQNPYLAADGKLNEAQARGEKTFQSVCVSCHGGPFYTDSAMGNTELDFKLPILLHDLGTCVKKGDFTDKPGIDVTSQTHTACDFDTPTLRGVFATAPYFHDGSARTLLDVIKRLPASMDLPAAEQADLVEFVKTL